MRRKDLKECHLGLEGAIISVIAQTRLVGRRSVGGREVGRRSVGGRSEVGRRSVGGRSEVDRRSVEGRSGAGRRSVEVFGLTFSIRTFCIEDSRAPASELVLQRGGLPSEITLPGGASSQ